MIKEGQAELRHEFCAFTKFATKLTNLPKTPASDGEEISLGDLTVPPELTKIERRKSKTTKNYPFPTQR